MTQQITCPICHTPATDPTKTPFCSERCRKIDFFRWWDGRYSIATSVDILFDSEGDETFYSPDEDSFATDEDT